MSYIYIFLNFNYLNIALLNYFNIYFAFLRLLVITKYENLLSYIYIFLDFNYLNIALLNYFYIYITFLRLLVITKCENLLSLVIMIFCRFFKVGQHFRYNFYIEKLCSNFVKTIKFLTF
jgi:hypothetical protein